MRRSTLFAVVGLVTFVSGCLPSSYVILLPDPDGRVGKVTVSGSGGTQTLEKARTGAGIKGSDEPFKISQQKITQVFGRAIAAQPEPPVSFMLYFFSDQARLKAESRKLLPAAVAAIEARTAPDVSIIGHSDRYGDRGYNHRLALRRARAIHRALVKAGVDPAIIDVTSHGENNPLVPTPDDVREAKNRRVEITVR